MVVIGRVSPVASPSAIPLLVGGSRLAQPAVRGRTSGGLLERSRRPDAWVTALRIFANQFDNQAVLGPYREAIEALAEDDRIRLYVMAARAPDGDFHAD
jgi:hypothetical protein